MYELEMANEISYEAMMNNLKDQSDEAREFFDISEIISAIIGDLVAARVRKGWTQRDLAAACGIQQSAIARMERFQVMPRLDTIVKIARELDIKISAVEMHTEETVTVSAHVI